MARRSASVLDPMHHPELAWRAREITRHAEAMGLLDEPGSLDQPRFSDALRNLAAHGIAADAVALIQERTGRGSRQRLAGVLDRVREALEDSSVPDLELRHLQRLFGWEELAALLGTSVGSLRRYASNQRATPDRIAARAHWLAGTVADLRDAYNDAGVRRWFVRPRTALRGRRPVEVLTGDWDPDQAEVREVRDLAAWLAQPGAAT
jgi:hypothetical protein